MWAVYDKLAGNIRLVSKKPPTLTEEEAEWLAVGEIPPGTEARPGRRFGDPVYDED